MRLPIPLSWPRFAAALVASVALGGVAPHGAASAQGPEADPPAAIPPAPASDAPSAPAAAPKPDPDAPPTFLLLTNGKVLQGQIQRTSAGFVLKHKIGVSVYPRAQVEQTFRSLHEVFAYKKALCPENDPDERLKLATWCLEQKDPKLKEEAKIQLLAVLELSPENRRARAMIGNIDRPQSPASLRDDQVGRAGAVLPTDPPIDVPPDASLERLREENARNPRSAGLPAIFDLETPVAVRRYGEFSSTIHPVLQKRCARCHNEATPNDFPLIQARTRKDLANDLIVRANLEATLRLLDRDDLSRSPLLIASGMTHGNGGKPVLGGPNTPEYRSLAAWVTSLRSAKSGPAASSASRPPKGVGTPSGESFASGRNRAVLDPAMPSAPSAPGDGAPPSSGPIAPAVPMRDLPAIPGSNLVDPRLGEDGQTQERVRGRPAGRLIPGSEVGLPNNPPPDEDFQTPPLRMKPPAARPASKGEKPGPREGEPAEPGKLAPGTPGTITLPTGEVVPVITKEMTIKGKDDPTKKPKIDPKKLEGFLKSRPSK